MTPSLCRLREAPSHLSCDTVFPVFRYRTLALLPPTKKIPRLRSGWRYGKNAFPTHSFFAWCTGYPFPTLSFRAQREIFFVPFFHDSFAKPFTGSTAPHLFAIRCFPFLAAKHAPSYSQRKRSFGFASDDDTWDIPHHAKKAPARAGAFCVRKTYLPNCASMVPAATAVPITPATFGPIACISR